MKNIILQNQGFQGSICLMCLAIFLATGGTSASEAGGSREKRASSFVRIGKGGHFADDVSADDTKERDNMYHPGATGLVKKFSNFVRIGRQGGSGPGDELGEESRRALGEESRRALGGVSGKLMSLPELAYVGKKASSFVRIGKADADDKEFDDENEVESKRDRAVDELANIFKRASSFVRIGKTSNFVRIGKSYSVPRLVRINRKPHFVRIGRSSSNELNDIPEKRASSFVRIGKTVGYHQENPHSYNAMRPFDIHDLKRQSHFVRIGKSGLYNQKRPSSFVRIGKSNLDGLKDYIERQQADKKASSFVRIGKSDSAPPYSMSSQYADSMPAPSENPYDQFDDEGPINVANRAYVRLGKIPSAHFVRIGKSDKYLVEPTMSEFGLSGLKRRSHSSFVRIGK